MSRLRTGLIVASGLMLAATLAGCAAKPGALSAQMSANVRDCGAEGCHPEVVSAQNEAVHARVACTGCHEGTGEAHAADPKRAIATTDWTIESCRPCHEGEATTYLYDDNAQVGPFGGSVRVPPQPKAETFPEYATIVAGHPFTRDYNEEGAHAFMLEDHMQTKRGKFETCMQCKSTKVAYAWQTGKPIRVATDTEITLTHTATGTIPAAKVTVPKDTIITYATDAKSNQVDAKAVLPDGTTYTSKPAPSADATANFNMLWASTVAATKETMPYGAGCNHCHDPHTGAGRIVRQEMLRSIEDTGGVAEKGGVNPYAADAEKNWEKASATDRSVLSCAQCHVEYVCGKSAVDGIDRDAFGWAKAKDLHELYSARFGYRQDWRHLIMGEPLIKSQHSETELFWDSVHYDAGAACADCHMPEVRTTGGRTFRSHWFTSPYKYSDAASLARFAEMAKLEPAFVDNPCKRCHEDRVKAGIKQQEAFFARQETVEGLLARSVSEFGKLRAAKAAGRPVREADYQDALTAHRKAHVLWENLAVSENSMGFHNFEEVMASMDEAEQQVRMALAKERSALDGK